MKEPPKPKRHGICEYLPERERPAKIALCLSGGGFRAALFHLGGLRRLNELGILSRVDTISSVSGGSILAAHLATVVRPWPEAGDAFHGWDQNVVVPFHKFVKRNLRTWAILNRLLPWNWFRDDTGVETLVKGYERRLTRFRLTDLPTHPRFVLCATDLVFGVQYVFDSGDGQARSALMGDYQAGYQPLPDWPLARAVAASSCFPPVFNPLRPQLDPEKLHERKYDGEDRDRLVRSIRLSDGGVYDNLGLEAVWKDHKILLVSDGGATFEPEADVGLFWRLQRYVGVVDSQARALRKRWLISNYLKPEFDPNRLEGAYWGIGSATESYKCPHFRKGYCTKLVDEVISEVRTDMDAFSGAEIAVLENHGYFLADVAIKCHAPSLIARDASFESPHGDWLGEEEVKKALADSHKNTLLGRW